MKTKLFVLVAVTVLAVLGIAGLAFAQGNIPPAYHYGMMGGRGGYGMMGSCYGMMGSGYGAMHAYMLPAFAEALGISPEELQSRLDGGETMWDVARAQGLSDEEVYQVMEAAHSQAIEQAVEAGVLTQEQAGWMDGHMEQMHGEGFAPGSCHGSNAAGPSDRPRSSSQDL